MLSVFFGERKAVSVARHLWLGLFSVAGLAACSVTHIPASRSARKTLPLPAALEQRYTPADQGPVKVSLELVREAEGYIQYLGTMERPGLESGEKQSEKQTQDAQTAIRKVTFDFYKLRQAKPRPAILCSPIMGGRGALERGIARSFAQTGFHAVLVHRVGKIFRSHWQPTDIEHHFREALADRRRILDWLDTLPEIDRGRVGAFGISMGGIITATLTPIEPRIHSSVIVMAGGRISDILTRTDEGPLVRYRNKRMEAEGLALEDFSRRLRAELVTDPLELAPYADPQRLLLFIARYDQIVPTDLQFKLRDALGKPECYTVPTGHYPTIAFLPYLRKKAIRFFRKRFVAANPQISPPTFEVSSRK